MTITSAPQETPWLPDQVADCLTRHQQELKQELSEWLRTNVPELQGFGVAAHVPTYNEGGSCVDIDDAIKLVQALRDEQEDYIPSAGGDTDAATGPESMQEIDVGNIVTEISSSSNATEDLKTQPDQAERSSSIAWSRRRPSLASVDSDHFRKQITATRWTLTEAEGAEEARTMSSINLGEASTPAEIKINRLKSRNAFHRIIAHPLFDRFFALMIIGSSLTVGAECEYTAVYMTQELPAVFSVLQMVFFWGFLIELVLRVAALRRLFIYGFDWPWNVFDAIVVFFSVVEAVATTVIQEQSSFLMVVRMIRIVRVARIIRVVRFLRQLRVMVYTLLGTLPNLCWSMVLISIILYVFSVCITQAVTYHLLSFEEPPAYADKMRNVFGRTPLTAYFLFQAVSSGVNWGQDVSMLFHLDIIYWGMFVAYIAITQFAMLNVVTGFFCENAIEMAQADKELLVSEMLRQKDALIKEFEKLFHDFDLDGSGEITYAEWEAMLDDEATQAYMSHLNINPSSAWTIFRLIDVDGTSSISVDEFIQGLLNLKGQSKSVDIASISFDLKNQGQMLKAFMLFVEREFRRLRAVPQAALASKSCASAASS
eukprot:TRINITY_DN27911_c0_g1_i1.p1 TRINITY_DN27911_c0_g1~~TRINITY_DN27911_c0_g1_i1.p1  ORF type:complete len:598 (+),score=101.07 TRINITY_DN27911_c0_g1_i1:104-1897(+)